MKHIHTYQIFESQKISHPYLPSTNEEINKLCKKYKIKNYTINDDLSINVDGDVDFYSIGLEYIPLNFNYVNGDFNCNFNKLVSLKGSPNKIEGSFECGSNKLKTLKGCPVEINKSFYCTNNNLNTLEYSPKKVGGFFNCSNNDIRTLNHCPKANTYIFAFNPINTLSSIFIFKKNSSELIREFNNYQITDGDKVYMERLEMFCSDFEIRMPLLSSMSKLKDVYKIVE